MALWQQVFVGFLNQGDEKINYNFVQKILRDEDAF